MGSEEKSNKKKRRHSSTHDEDVEKEEKRSKKHRSSREDKEKKKKKSRDREEKRKKKGNHKSSNHPPDEGKRSRKKHDDISSFEEISDSDYFSKNNEFSTWLKEEKRIYFSDLSSEEARKLFKTFIKDWNAGKLQSQYYEGITIAQRSSHNWKIKRDK